MPTCPKMYVAPPTIEPYRFGLLSVAQRPAETDAHWRCGVQWEPYACGPARTYGDQCDNPNVQKDLDDGVPLVEADAFTVYASYLCRLPGRPDWADIEDRARQAMRLGEQRAIEQTVWTGDKGNNPHLADPGAVVLNAVPAPAAADAFNMPAAIGALESYLRTNYGGTGVIHAPAGAIPIMARYHQFCDCSTPLRTWLGTPVAAYAVSPNTGPDGTPAPDGTVWLYATGPVAIRMGPVILNPPSIDGALNRVTNEVAVLAEREVVVGWDCVHAAVLANISC